MSLPETPILNIFLSFIALFASSMTNAADWEATSLSVSKMLYFRELISVAITKTKIYKIRKKKDP